MDMIKVLTFCNPGFFFALAGQAVVERALFREFLKRDNVFLRIIMQNSPSDYNRFRDHFELEIQAGKVQCIEESSIDEQAYFEGIDLFMAHGMGAMVTLIIKHEIMNKMPVFIHLHSLELMYDQRTIFSLPWSFWSKKYPAFFISPTNSNARRISRIQHSMHLYDKPFPFVQVVPHGFDRDKIEGGDRKIGREFLKLSAEDKVILSFNRITYQKFDYVQLVLAFHQLIQKFENKSQFKLLLVGSASTIEKKISSAVLGKLIKDLNLEQQVGIHFGVEEEIKKHIFAAADVFVSLACNPQESFGITLLEAQAAGLPILATDWNGYPEVLPEVYKPWLVPTIASDDLSRKLEWTSNWSDLTDAAAPHFDSIIETLYELLSNSELAIELSQAGLQHVKQFTWNKTTSELVELWQFALNEVGNDDASKEIHSQLKKSHAQKLTKIDETRQQELSVINSSVGGLASYYLNFNSILSLRQSEYEIAMRDLIKYKLPEDASKNIQVLIEALRKEDLSLNKLFVESTFDYVEFHKLVIFLIRRGVLNILDI
jgi:glycosyltransferase involved in cell wall biosynthesis